MAKRHLISGALFCITWVLFAHASGVYEHMHQLPIGVHQGAQCDRASLAQNYYYGGFRFLYPEVNETRCTDGIVSCELPLTSYLAACLYKIFSYDEFYFRLISYLFFSLGMMALFFLFKTRLRTLPSLALVLLIQSSPIILFYCNNFLPDISSLGLVLIAWLLFFSQHIQHPYLPTLKQRAWQILFIICLSLAVAVKTTSLLQWLTMAVLLGLSFFKFSKIEIQQKNKLLISLSVSICVPLVWYLWSRHLSITHNYQYFMMGVPDFNGADKYWEAWAVYLANWPGQALSYPIVCVAVALCFLTVFLKKFIQTELWTITLVNTAGSTAFLFLMMEQFKYHDYYVICLFPAFALNWLALSDAVRRIPHQGWWAKILVLSLILFALNYQFHTGKKNLEERYTEGNYWEQSHHKATDLDSFRLQLKALGIDRNICVVAGYDAGPNNMLYLLHLRGHRFSKEHDDSRVGYITTCYHPHYMISNDSSFTAIFSKQVKSATLKSSFKKYKLYELEY